MSADRIEAPAAERTAAYEALRGYALGEAPAPTKRQVALMLQDVHPSGTLVAVVREQLDDNRAIIEWLYNPVPEGEPLHWPNQP